jgi:hypothetical protein
MKKSDQKKALIQLRNAWDEVEKLALLSGMDETAAARFTSAQLSKWADGLKWDVKEVK